MGTLTIGIIIITVIVSFNAFTNADLRNRFIFYPYQVNERNEYYRFFSHMLIHGDTMHLFFNMFVLFSFGSNIENTLLYEFGNFGWIHFLIIYIIGGFVAGIWPYQKNKDNIHYRSLGASGAVSAILFANILWFPEGSLYLMFIPYPIPSWLFGILYLAFEYYMGKRGGTRIAHDAHFGGAIFGIGYVLLIDFDKGINFINLISSKLSSLIS
jgi:membrane associated rhomboid family serine protease